MKNKLVVVFGGSGFTGTHIVRALCKDGWRVRVACRRPDRALHLQVCGQVGQVQLVQANIRMPASIDRALRGADAVINLVGVLFEQGRQKFSSLHARGAELVANRAAAHDIDNFIHLSALGADEQAPSLYAQSKGAGERLVRKAVPKATILRPSVIFGPGDGLFERFASMARLSPVLPLIGGGHTRFAPLYVGDLARAVLAALNEAQAKGQTYELGGPQTMTLEQIMRAVLHTTRRKRLLVPVPFFVAGFMGLAGEIMGAIPFVEPFLTRDQVILLKTDNVPDGTLPGCEALSITELETVEAMIPKYLARYRHHGQFNAREAA
jgi:uncharacterized protein YbjT (DUF2867 family)